jgi:hypothetical protein
MDFEKTLYDALVVEIITIAPRAISPSHPSKRADLWPTHGVDANITRQIRTLPLDHRRSGSAS